MRKKIGNKTNYLQLPIGCLGGILLMLFWGAFLTIRIFKDSKISNEKELRWRNEEQSKIKTYKSYFDYNLDSIAEIPKHVSESWNITQPVKQKGIVFVKRDGKYVIDLAPICQLPDKYIAYNLKDLNTIIVQEYSKERSIPNHMGERDVVDLTFIDIQSSKIVHSSRIKANNKPYIAKSGRGAGAIFYNLSSDEVQKQMVSAFQ
jgi:butyrate kinase